MSLKFKEGTYIDAIETTYQRLDDDYKPVDVMAYTRHIEIKSQVEPGVFGTLELDSRSECERFIAIIKDLSNKCFGGTI